MRLSKKMLLVLLAGAVIISVTGCQPGQTAAPTSTTEVVIVQRGDISVGITAVGNLALSLKQDLAFEIPGTVQEVLVAEGDSVENGQVLARLDTTEWDKQLTALERQALTAERQVTTAQKQLRDKQAAVTTAQNNVVSKEYALRQAQLDYQSANETLNQMADVKRVQDKIDNAEETIRFANNMLYSGVLDLTNWTDRKRNAETELALAKKELQDILAGNSLAVSTNVQLDIAKKQLAVEQKQFGVKQAQLDLDISRVALEDAKFAVAPTEVDLKNAQADLKTAQKNLDDARKNGPEVKAPFAGFITRVNVKGGDEVKKGTVAVTIADPDKFQADILVSEIDISKVKLGGAASVELQAASGAILTANVTHISPTATIQQNVVNYQVTVELGSAQPAAQASRTGLAGTAGNTTAAAPSGRPGDGPGTLPGGAFGSANLTQEQINQRFQQRQQAFGGAPPTQEQIDQLLQQRQQALAGQGGGQFPFGAGQIPGFGGELNRQPQAAAAPVENIRLAEGMTVTVSIPVDNRTNVVRAPNGSISTKSGQRFVMVVKADGSNEERVIQTGISDFQYTEVTGGLSDGEHVLVKKSTATTSAPGGQTNQLRIPGVGGAFGR